MRRRRVSAAAVPLAALLLATSCTPSLVVRVTTRVWPDDSLDRRVELHGRTADGEEPTEADWLATRARIRLADPAAWDRIEIAAGRLVAEGTFPDAGALPRLFVHETTRGPIVDGTTVRLEHERRGVIERWVWIERHTDPYGPAETEAALAALVELTTEALRSEVHTWLGDAIDTSAAERVLRKDALALFADLVAANRAAGDRRAAEPAWRAILERHDVSPVTGAGEDFWERQGPLLSVWLRDRVAAALIAPEPIPGEQLAFWPVGDAADARIEQISTRVWGDADRAAELALPHLTTLAGYYGAESSTRHRFEIDLRLPGTPLRTNGTLVDDRVVWLLRDADLNAGELELRAESVALLPDALVALGARRDLDGEALLRLTDLLWQRDPQRQITAALERAIAAGDLGELLDPDLPEAVQPLAFELAELLDPETDRR